MNATPERRQVAFIIIKGLIYVRFSLKQIASIITFQLGKDKGAFFQ